MYPNIYLHFPWKKHTCWILVHSEASVSLSAYVPTYHLHDSVSKKITTQNQKGNSKLSVICSLVEQPPFHPVRSQSQPSSPAPKRALEHDLLYREHCQSCCRVFVFSRVSIFKLFSKFSSAKSHSSHIPMLFISSCYVWTGDKILWTTSGEQHWWVNIHRRDGKWKTVASYTCCFAQVYCICFERDFMPFECFKKSTFCPERKLKSLVALSLKILLLSYFHLTHSFNVQMFTVV